MGEKLAMGTPGQGGIGIQKEDGDSYGRATWERNRGMFHKEKGGRPRRVDSEVRAFGEWGGGRVGGGGG